MQWFGVISNLLEVATSPIAQLAIDLDLQKQQKKWRACETELIF